MRLIDADKLKKCVLKWLPQDPCGREEKEMPFETDICVSMLMEIDEQHTITPEPHWIPVTERLPEKSGEYLVTVKWVTGESDVDVYEYDARHKTWNDGESAGGERAVAWCNLPEPFEGVTT